MLGKPREVGEFEEGPEKCWEIAEKVGGKYVNVFVRLWLLNYLL